MIEYITWENYFYGLGFCSCIFILMASSNPFFGQDLGQVLWLGVLIVLWPITIFFICFGFLVHMVTLD